MHTLNHFVQGDHINDYDPAALTALNIDETMIDGCFFKVLEAKLNVVIWEIYMKEFSQHEPSVLVNMGAKNKSDALRVALPVTAGTRLPYIGRIVHTQNRSSSGKTNYMPCCEVLGVICLHDS